MIEKLDPIKHTDNLYDKNGFITNVACGGVVISKINELVDAVNELQESHTASERFRIDGMDDPFGPHPNIYEQSMRMDKEFAEDECVRLQNELDRTRGALNIAIKTLKFIEHQGNCTDVEDEAFDCLQMIKSLGVEL